MVKITQVRLWNDVGYLEGDTCAPKIGALLPTPTYISTDVIIPSKDRLFSELQLTVPHNLVDSASYIEITLDYGNETYVYYGWVDEVSIRSEERTNISYHIDHWRTYIDKCTFKGGYLENSTSSDFPQQFAMNRWSVDRVIFMMENSERLSTDPQSHIANRPMQWLYFSLASTEATPELGIQVLSLLCCAPIRDQDTYIKDVDTADSRKTLTLSDVVLNRWDEVLKMDPKKIKGAWLSPLPPEALGGTGTQSDPFYLRRGSYEDRRSAWKCANKQGSNASVFVCYKENSADDSQFMERGYSESGLISNDTTRFVITGFDGEPIGELPWGVQVSSIKYRMCMSVTSCYIQVRPNINGPAEGMSWTIPCMPLDMLENAWSSYSYSGQKDYDRSMRNTKLVSGALSTIASAGGTSATVGSLLAQNKGSAVLGTAIAQGSSGFGLMETFIEQQRREQLVQRQSASLLGTGNGFDGIYYGRSPALIVMKGDAPSIRRRANNLAQYGYTVGEYRDDLNSLIRAGGTLRISDLTVLGDVPAESKRYIKNKLAQGVRMI